MRQPPGKSTRPPEEQLADLIYVATGYKISPQELRACIRANWKELARLAHETHAQAMAQERREQRIEDPVHAIARVCHEVNRAYCESQGDRSQPSWHMAPGWQRESAINGVRFALRHPNAKPSDSHESWLAEKHAAGWAYGLTKDPERKLHPCFVPYEELAPQQKAKDYIFLAVVRALAPAWTVANQSSAAANKGDASP